MRSVRRRFSEASTTSRICGPAVGPGKIPAGENEAEFRRDGDLVAAPLQRAAEELLVREGAIALRRIEEIASQLDGAVEGRDRFAVIPLAIGVAHAHAAEADG
jgi:hypothetical protein